MRRAAADKSGQAALLWLAALAARRLAVATGFAAAIVLSGTVGRGAAAPFAASVEGLLPVCFLIEGAASENGLPPDFLTRLIWKESRFIPTAVSPKGARGIAQFMPMTASLRGLADPFDPPTAIRASANYLAELATRFGNLGLAAAAYNAGEGRVGDWLHGKSSLPAETEDFVATITGRSAAGWKGDVSFPPAVRDDEDPTADCLETAAALRTGRGGPAIAAASGAAPPPWGVQVAGGFSESRALADYGAMQRSYAAILGDKPPLVLHRLILSRGRQPLVQVRVPAATREEANQICARLSSAGGSCIVLRN